MTTYRECPECDEANHGFGVYLCKNCGFKGCFKLEFQVFSPGCWKSEECPACRERSFTKTGMILTPRE